jgi:hypothetical protein
MRSLVSIEASRATRIAGISTRRFSFRNLSAANPLSMLFLLAFWTSTAGTGCWDAPPIEDVTSWVNHFFPDFAVEHSTSGASARLGLHPTGLADTVNTVGIGIGHESATSHCLGA